jgi:hypothetical protein
MNIKLMDESNSQEIRDYLLSSTKEAFIDEYFNHILFHSTLSQFRNLLFSGSAISYATYKDNKIENLGIFSLPTFDNKISNIQVISLPYDNLEFFRGVIEQLSPFIKEDNISKIVSYIVDRSGEFNQGQCFEKYGFINELSIPIYCGSYIHFSYFIKSERCENYEY